MRFPVKTTVALAVLGVGGALAYPPAHQYWKARNAPVFREAEVSLGDIIEVVNSTGTVQPVLRIPVGSFASGPIKGLFVDYNAEVTKGQLMAQIDPNLYQARVDRDQAALATRQADVERVEADRAQAANNLERAEALRKENPDYISEMEMDKYRFSLQALKAQLNVAEASVRQAEANLKDSQTYLDYTRITAPRDGVVIDRKIDEGQTLTSQFQITEMFILAPDMEKEMHVEAKVDEADIGKIVEAQRVESEVLFTVDAYPGDLFRGKIYQVRVDPKVEMNVVTYEVVVSAPNPGMKLLPGMTANLSFQVDKREGILRIPNGALRYYPDREHVRPEDQDLLEGTREEEDSETDQAATEIERSATQRAEGAASRRTRHVWVREGDLLRAVEVTTGLSDNKYTELAKGELEEGQKLVVP